MLSANSLQKSNLFDYRYSDEHIPIVDEGNPSPNNLKLPPSVSLPSMMAFVKC